MFNVELSASAALIAYGLAEKLWRVLALHFVPVPINAWRPLQTFYRRQDQREQQAQQAASASP